MVEVSRHREHVGARPLGRAAIFQMLETDLTRHTEPFGDTALAEYAKAQRTTEVSVVRMAALYYLADRDTGRRAWSVPRFVRQRGTPSVAAEGSLIALDEDTRAAIGEEAFRQGVSAAVLANHAVLYFLADADSGRLAGRLGETLEDGER